MSILMYAGLTEVFLKNTKERSGVKNARQEVTAGKAVINKASVAGRLGHYKQRHN